jgi:hypothetical protein
MTKERASVFGDAEIDISSFAPKAPDADAPAPEQVRKVAEAAHFPSRESKAPKVSAPTKVKRTPRRHRTGRNVQLNLKASQETVDSFYTITDRKGWVLGQTLEEAVHALQRELERNK